MLFFCLFQCFKETEYQTESKRNKTFGNVIFSPNVIQETWTLLQGTKEAATRVEGAPPLLGVPPISWAPRASADLFLPPIYTHVPQEHQGRPRKTISTTVTFCIREIPSWSLRRRSAGGGTDHVGPLHHLQGLSYEL